MSYALYTDEDGNQTLIEHGHGITFTLINGQAPIEITDQQAQEIIAQSDTETVQS